MITKPRLVGAAVLGIMAAVTWTLTPPARTVDPAPIKILSIGDSITHGGSHQTGYGPAYRTELTRLLNLAGVPHTYEISAWPGQSCAYIASEMPLQLSAYKPDLVILNCGTNDSPGATETPYRQMLHMFTATATPAVISWIGYIDPRIAPQAPWLLPNQRAANDAIYRARFFTPAATPPVADFQVIPGDAEHLVPYNGTTPDGIHPTARGYKAMAHLIYAKAAPLMGWPSLAALGEPPVCGLRGNWHQYPEPLPSRDYLECTQP